MFLQRLLHNMSVSKSQGKPLFKKSLKPTFTAYLQIFGTGAGDTSPSIYLFADSQRYIFSCGESTQRSFHENKLKFGKLNNLFLTQISWNLIGGLPGLLLTLRDLNKTTLTLHGPYGLSQFIKSTKQFVMIQNMDLNCSEYTGKDNEQYEDENIIITPICIEGKESDNLHSEITEIETNMDKQEGFTYQENPSKRCKLSPKPVISYICQLTHIPGKINIKKAINVGVPVGPMIGQLQNGKTITLKNGHEVKPEDIMEESSEFGCVFCIIDCPNKQYFDSLIMNKQLVMYETGGSKTQPTIMIHLTPAALVNIPEYVEWTKRFGNSCQHLFLNSEMSSPKVAMLSQLRIQYKLHQLDNDIFPRLFASDCPNIVMKGDDKSNWKAAESYLIYHLRPTLKLGYDYCDIKGNWSKMIERTQDKKYDVNNSIKDFMDPGKFLNSKNLILSEKIYEDVLKNKDEHFEIVFLGTGASLPSKYRNVSSTLVNISKDKVMLLDCGEGTYGQLYRHYGPDLKKILFKLCCVFISHIHADHHLGLIQVLQAWEKSNLLNRRDAIVVVGPPSLYSWLENYGTFCETLHLRFLDSSKCQNENFIDSFGYKVLSSVLEAEKVTIVPVIHCYHAFGLVFTHRNGWKLVYSGDTRPCNDLIKEGMGATVLIHEATFEDDLHSEAIAKYHCTTTEAIECGEEMKAEFILLNHFSQRYPKIPIFNKKYNERTGISFDHMRVNFQNITRVSKLLGPLQDIFKEEIQEQKTPEIVLV